jgi:hypothetical protein
VQRRFIDDLQAVRIPRLRALDLIAAETTQFLMRLGEVEQSVAVTLRKFPNQGSWSLFVCPTCGRCAQVLRLLDDVLVCRRCCIRRGVRRRADPMSVRQRAEHRIPKLRAMLESPVSLRLKPVLWGRMERRARLEAALRRCEFIVSQGHGRFRDVLERTPELEPEPIARPKVKTTPSRPR